MNNFFGLCRSSQKKRRRLDLEDEEQDKTLTGGPGVDVLGTVQEEELQIPEEVQIQLPTIPTVPIDLLQGEPEAPNTEEEDAAKEETAPTSVIDSVLR